MKKKIFLVLSVCVFTLLFVSLFTLSASATEYSGSCGAEGDNVTWHLDTETGVFTVSGEGYMQGYTFESPWKAYRSEITSVIFESGVLNVADSSFRACNNITSVELADTVTIIGTLAFEECTGLTNIEFINSVIRIGSSAFRGCTGLTSVEIPASVTKIEGAAFADCTMLENIVIPDSVTDIGANVFSNTKYYNSDSNWDNGLLYIGNHLIKAAGYLTSINIPDSVITISPQALKDCTSLEKLEIPFVKRNGENSSVTVGSLFGRIPETLKTVVVKGDHIPGSAFKDCTGVENIYISDSVVSIWYDALAYCPNLKSIVVEEGNSVYYSESNCLISKEQKYLVAGTNTSIIPSDVKDIGSSAFQGKTGLIDIKIPNSVTQIWSGAFYGCSNLKSVEFTKTVTRISLMAFYGCNSLETVYFGGTEEEWNAIYVDRYNDALATAEIIFCEHKLNDGETVSLPTDANNGLKIYTCAECGATYEAILGICGDDLIWEFFEKEQTLIISGTGVMYDYVFDSYYDTSTTPWDAYRERIATIIVENGVETIGQFAFSERHNVNYATTKIVIADSVKSIGISAFYNCQNLVYIEIPNSVEFIGASAFSCCKSLKSIKIPDSVTSINNNTFQSCSALEYIEIPDSVTSIGEWAFNGCTSLVNIELPDSLVSIGRDALSSTGYYVNESNWENDVLYLGEYLISAKKSLSGEYTIKDGTKIIADYAFPWNTGLTSVIIPKSVVSIGYGAFFSNDSLTSVTMEDCAAVIGDDAFYSCRNLTYVSLGNFIKEIGADAFHDSILREIVIPCSVTSIGEAAFYYCFDLVSAIYLGDEGGLIIDSRNECLTDVLTYTNKHNYPEGKDRCASCGKYRDEIASLYGYSISLEGDITVNFYFDVAESTATDECAYVLLTYADGSTEQIPLSELRTKISSVSGDTYYIATVKVAAKDYETSVSAQIILGDGTEGIKYSHSVNEYANTIFLSPDGTYSQELIDMLAEMIWYCYNAKQYFDEVSADHLDVLVTQEQVSHYQPIICGSEEGISYYGSSLLLESKTTIRHYFVVTGDISEYSFAIDGNIVAPIREGDSDYWYVDIENIVAADLNRTYELTVGDITVRYSAMSYVYKALPSDDIALVNVVKTLYLYSVAADAYFENIEVEQ